MAVTEILEQVNETELHGPLIFGLVALVVDFGERHFGRTAALQEALIGYAVRGALQAEADGDSDPS